MFKYILFFFIFLNSCSSRFDEDIRFLEARGYRNITVSNFDGTGCGGGEEGYSLDFKATKINTFTNEEVETSGTLCHRTLQGITLNEPYR